MSHLKGEIKELYEDFNRIKASLFPACFSSSPQKKYSPFKGGSPQKQFHVQSIIAPPSPQTISIISLKEILQKMFDTVESTFLTVLKRVEQLNQKLDILSTRLVLFKQENHKVKHFCLLPAIKEMQEAYQNQLRNMASLYDSAVREMVNSPVNSLWVGESPSESETQTISFRPDQDPIMSNMTSFVAETFSAEIPAARATFGAELPTEMKQIKFNYGSKVKFSEPSSQSKNPSSLRGASIVQRAWRHMKGN